MNAARLQRIARKAAIALWPERVWRRYDQQARRAGLDRLYLLLSFDCDTPQDIEAVKTFHPWLQERGFKATYAVPGAQLEQGREVYQALADQGADFINHGGLPHMEWRDDRYWSITFYNQMSAQAVIADVQRGHELVQQVTGQKPVGFRAPHFGHFQQPEQLDLLYRTLCDLDYRFATTTTPASALANGPIYPTAGLYEIPVSGTFRAPLTILDSWGQIADPRQPVVQDTYARRFIATVSALQARRVAGVLNYYVDPAHVVNSAAFYKALEFARARGLESLHYGDLLERIRI